MKRRMRFGLIVAVMPLALASLARAESVIVTPRLVAPAGGSLFCAVVNASDSKTLDVTKLQIFGYDGSLLVNAGPAHLLPNSSFDSGTSNASARHCVVRIAKGGKRAARVSLYALGSSGIVAAVAGE